MKRYIPLSLCLALFLVTQPVWAFDLTLLHVNDSHSYLESTGDTLVVGGEKTSVKLGAWPRLKTVVEQVRKERENVALLHAGDAVQGGLYFMAFSGVPEMDFLTRLRFDAMVLGNHEFDKGSKFLAQMLDNTRTPIVGANVDASGVPPLAARIEPYTILSIGEERVGIIGLTSRDTTITSSPGPQVKFADEVETARKYTNILEAQGVDKIILLTHVGLENDKKLAAEVPGVDIIVGGHSHSLLADPKAMDALGKDVDGPYPVIVKGPSGDPVYVVTAWKWARVLGRLDVTFDDTGRITAAQGKPMLLLADDFRRKGADGAKVPLVGSSRQDALNDINANPVASVVAEDLVADAFLQQFTEGVSAMHSLVLGVAQKSLPHIAVPGVTKSGLPLPHGSLIAPLVAQSMVDKIHTTEDSVDIGLVNAGGVRHSIDQGKITVGMAYTLMPFQNTLYLLDISGKQVKAALEYGVTYGRGGFPYVAGMRYSADMTRPQGRRIVSVDVHGKDGQWLPLDMKATYRMVTNSYLANGGDGYALLKDVKKRYDTGFVDTQAFIDFVKERKILLPPESTGVTYKPAK